MHSRQKLYLNKLHDMGRSDNPGVLVFELQRHAVLLPLLTGFCGTDCELKCTCADKALDIKAPECLEVHNFGDRCDIPCPYC